MGKHKNNSSLGKNSAHPCFPYSLDVFLYLRVFPHKSCHIAYHEVKLNLQPDHQHDHLIHKWQCVLTGSLDSFHFAGMGDSRCPVTWGPMVYNYKYLVFKRLRDKVKFLAFIIIWFNHFFNRPVSQTNAVTDEIQVWVLPLAAQCSIWQIIFIRKFLPEVHTKQPCLVLFNFKYHQSIRIKASISLFVQ